MDGNGVLYTIDKLGQALAQAEQEIARLKQENAALREQAAQPDEKPKP